MNIAFISYEYPPDTAYGGIATYVHQAAMMLSRRGHHVEVFSGSPHRTGTENEECLLVHRINVKNQFDFAKPIGQLFAQRHKVIQFDVLEGPDCAADAREAVRIVPDIPFVLKLHTPSILLLKLNYYEYETSFLKKICLYVAAFLKGVMPVWGYAPSTAAHRLHILQIDKIEQSHALEADEFVSPSLELGNILIRKWGLDKTKISHVPYPYVPSEKLLKISVETHTNIITFIGRLEMRKGVLDLARAIPLILRHYPDAKFRFVGSAEHSPQRNLDMRQYLERMLQNNSRLVEFISHVPFDAIPNVLAETDICVFPSLWENFPCVCLEAMAAARGIVGSNAGGMAEMLDYGNAGRLVPPHSPKNIAQAVVKLLNDTQLRMGLGRAARNRLLEKYNTDSVGILQEASYLRAIKRRQAQGSRLQKNV